MYFPATRTPERGRLASVLDLEQYRLAGSNPRSRHTRHDQTILMLISMNDVNSVLSVILAGDLDVHPLQDDQMHSQMPLMILQVFRLVLVAR